MKKGQLYNRVAEISQDYERGVRLMDLARKVGEDNDVPFLFRYWF